VDLEVKMADMDSNHSKPNINRHQGTVASPSFVLKMKEKIFWIIVNEKIVPKSVFLAAKFNMMETLAPCLN
jgi:hypothetical protein